MSSTGTKRKLTDYFRSTPPPAPQPFPHLASESSELSSISSTSFTCPQPRSTAWSNNLNSGTQKPQPEASTGHSPLPHTPSKSQGVRGTQPSLSSPPPSSSRIVPILTPRRTNASPTSNPPSRSLIHRHNRSPTRSTARDREAFIRDSDEGEGATSDDSDGLFNVATLLRPPRSSKATNSASGSASSSRRLAPANLWQQSLKAAKRKGIALPAPKPRVYRFTLAKLVSEQEEQDISNATLNSIKDAMWQAEYSATHALTGPIDGKVIDRLAKSGDPDDAERVKHAIERTEALTKIRRWRFIDWWRTSVQSEATIRPQVDSCPFIAVDDTAFENDLLCGHLATLASLGQRLPISLIAWMIRQLAVEKRDALRAAYSYTLLSDPSTVATLLKPTFLASLLKQLGVQQQVVHFGTRLSSTSSIDESTKAPDIGNLIAVLDLLRKVAHHLQPDCRIYLLQALARLSLDDEVDLSVKLCISISELFAALMEPYSAEDWLVTEPTWIENLCAGVENLELRSRLLLRMPRQTARARAFRRRLATCMLLNLSSDKIPTLDSKPILPRLTRKLTKNSFTISETTDYPALSYRMSIVDIAVGDGMAGVDVPFRTKAEENEFNRQVDTFTAVLKGISSRIVDTGASHMSRSEAKQIIDRVHHRVLYAVRTRQRPRKGIFGRDIAGADLLKMLRFKDENEEETEEGDGENNGAESGEEIEKGEKDESQEGREKYREQEGGDVKNEVEIRGRSTDGGKYVEQELDPTKMSDD